MSSTGSMTVSSATPGFAFKSGRCAAHDRCEVGYFWPDKFARRRALFERPARARRHDAVCDRGPREHRLSPRKRLTLDGEARELREVAEPFR